jgi:hypothetical protein
MAVDLERKQLDIKEKEKKPPDGMSYLMSHHRTHLHWRFLLSKSVHCPFRSRPRSGGSGGSGGHCRDTAAVPSVKKN